MSLEGLDQLGPGIFGLAFEHPEGIYISLIVSEAPGQGNAGAFLDSLPTDRRIVFPVVVSDVLAGMLERRGFTLTYEWSDSWYEMVDVYERHPVPFKG
jgi:hypothetical protein